MERNWRISEFLAVGSPGGNTYPRDRPRYDPQWLMEVRASLSGSHPSSGAWSPVPFQERLAYPQTWARYGRLQVGR